MPNVPDDEIRIKLLKAGIKYTYNFKVPLVGIFIYFIFEKEGNEFIALFQVQPVGQKFRNDDLIV